jgi:hypothetical protein
MSPEPTPQHADNQAVTPQAWRTELRDVLQLQERRRKMFPRAALVGPTLRVALHHLLRLHRDICRQEILVAMDPCTIAGRTRDGMKTHGLAPDAAECAIYG